MPRLTTTQWVETAEWLLFTGENILYREQDPLEWVDRLVDRTYGESDGLQGRGRLQSYFWKEMRPPKQLRCLLLLLTRNRRAIGQLIKMDRRNAQLHINDIRRSAMRWMLGTCHRFIDGWTIAFNRRHYRQMLAALRPTQAQINDFYRYLCWCSRGDLVKLSGMAELIGATELTDSQLFRLFKRWS